MDDRAGNSSRNVSSEELRAIRRECLGVSKKVKAFTGIFDEGSLTSYIERSLRGPWVGGWPRILLHY